MYVYNKYIYTYTYTYVHIYTSFLVSFSKNGQLQGMFLCSGLASLDQRIAFASTGPEGRDVMKCHMFFYFLGKKYPS